jgi:hypothetical protein
MAFSGPNVPNMVVVRYVMDNVWSVGRLETYITTYRPGGPPLHVLRHLLGHANLPAHDYARCLSQLASLLFGLGHVKPVNVVVAELLRNIPPGHLTPQQVHFCIYKILLSYSVTVSYSKIPIGLVLLPRITAESGRRRRWRLPTSSRESAPVILSRVRGPSSSGQK